MSIDQLVYMDKFILSNVCSNALDGAWWGFCSIDDYNALKSNEDISKNDQVSFNVLKGESGVLINVEPSYSFSLLEKFDELDINSEDLDESNALNMSGLLTFRLFLNKNKSYKGFIGVNEISDSITVSVSQKLYPSFKVDFKGVMKEFEELNVDYLDENNNWVKYKKGISTEDFIKSFTMSPTRNCMVLPIRLS